MLFISKITSILEDCFSNRLPIIVNASFKIIAVKIENYMLIISKAQSTPPPVDHGEHKILQRHFSVPYKRGRIPISAEIMEFILMDQTDITTGTFLRVFHI